MLRLYHAEPGANSLKCLIPIEEKGLAFESVYVDLRDRTNPALRTFSGEVH